jgi:hypothetical protein
MRSLTSADDLRPWFRPGAEIFVAGCLGESQRFIEWLKSQPTLADGVRFTGVLIPGANRFDYAGLHPNARMRTVFASPDWSGPATAARHECLPLGYRDAYAWLSRQRFDAVLVQGAPDGGGLSLSAAADFTPAALQHAGAVIAHRNARLPVTDAPKIRAPDAVLDADSDLPAYDAGPIGDTMRKLALNVLRLIEPGATLQLGLGKLQSALLAALPPGRELRVHSGMVSSAIAGSSSEVRTSISAASTSRTILAPWHRSPVSCRSIRFWKSIFTVRPTPSISKAARSPVAADWSTLCAAPDSQVARRCWH